MIEYEPSDEALPPNLRRWADAAVLGTPAEHARRARRNVGIGLKESAGRDAAIEMRVQVQWMMIRLNLGLPIDHDRVQSLLECMPSPPPIDGKALRTGLWWIKPE